jgi:hypothetical protein
MTITVDDLKVHLNLTDDDDDYLLQGKLDTATAFVENYTGAPLGDTPPAPLIEAVLQLAAHLYENREATLIGITVRELPFGLFDLLTPYRAWSF